MANPNGRKGASFERLIADYLGARTDSPYIDRRVKTGAADKGDIANFYVGSHKVVVECKNLKRTDLAQGLTEAQKEAVNDGALAGIYVKKRRGKGKAEDQYAILTLGDLMTLLEAATMAGGSV